MTECPFPSGLGSSLRGGKINMSERGATSATGVTKGILVLLGFRGNDTAAEDG